MDIASNIKKASDTCAVLEKMGEEYQKEIDKGSTNMCYHDWLDAQNIMDLITDIERKVDEEIRNIKRVKKEV